MANPLNKQPELKQLIQEEVDQRIWDNDPPEIKPTLERLETAGYSRPKTVERIERVLARTYLERDGFDQERFVKLLKELT